MNVLSVLNPLSAALDAGRFGGKAAQLAVARRAGLPVPDGWALGWDDVEGVVRQDGPGREVEAALRAALDGRGPAAVRSSAVGEDSDRTSFAGAHLTVLGLMGGDAVARGVREVHASALGPGALAYRTSLEVAGAVRMGVVVQEMVDADVAGVLFSRDPLTGDDELVIEAGWGLGEAVVSGIVTPDHLRVGRDGTVLTQLVGEKDVAIRLTRDGRVQETAVPPDLARAPCLGIEEVRQLHGLVRACDEVYGDDPHDIEFAFAGGSLYLLQRRPITHG